MPPDQAWKRIAAESYALPKARLIKELSSYSHHYDVACGGARYVLSQVKRSPDRLPFPLQFKIISLLQRGGVTSVNMPVPTVDGRRYVEDTGHYWFLRNYRPHDKVIWRGAPMLVQAAARELADIHRAGTGYRIAALGGVGTTHLAPYYQPVEAFLSASESAYHAAGTTGLPFEDRCLLAKTLRDLREYGQKMLDESRSRGLVGITHHDYRPDNILVRDRQIIEILDWDCASVDHQLYDLAFAALQYGQRQCLHDADIGLAYLFIHRYLTERGLEHLPGELMWWFLRFTVAKRVLIKGRNNERMRLLRLLDMGPLPCRLPDIAAQWGKDES